MTMWVLTKQYHDGSGFYVVRVYGSKERAEEDVRLVQDDSGFLWKLHEVPVFDTDPEGA